MKLDRAVAIGLAVCLLGAGGLLVFERGGLLAWLGVVLGAALLVKSLQRPASRDALLAAAVLATWVLSWGATGLYVVSTWESGEVVELALADGHVARVWVLDTGDGPVMYYDAPPLRAALD